MELYRDKGTDQTKAAGSQRFGGIPKICWSLGFRP